MKKTIALLIMAVFLVSLLPVVFAEDTAAATGTSDTPLKDKIQENKEKRAEIGELRGDAQDIRQEARGERKELRQDIKDKVKACKEAANESVDCKEVRKELKVNVKARLTITADEMIQLMENLKQKIEVLNPADKDALIAEVDGHIANVNAIKAEITALPDDATKEQYKEVTKKLKDEWDSARKAVRFHATRMVALGFERVLVKAERLEAKLDSTLARLKEKGFDTSKADAKIAEFKVHVADARKSYDEAIVLLEQYRADTSKENAVKAIQEKMKEAKKDLQLAQQSLREAVKEIKASGKDGAGVMKEEVEKEDKSSDAKEVEKEDTEETVQPNSNETVTEPASNETVPDEGVNATA